MIVKKFKAETFADAVRQAEVFRLANGLKAEQTNKQESDQSCELTCFFSRIKPETENYGFPAWQE